VRAVFIHGPQSFRLDEVADPEIGDDDALVRVRACGVCGSDLAYIGFGNTGFNKPWRGPAALGHESAGEVVAVGRNVTGVAVGERVAINPTDAAGGTPTIGNGGPEGAFADLLRVRNAQVAGRLIPLPDGLDFDVAALAEPMGVALHAVRRSPVGPESKVVVVGVGPIGLGALIWLKHAGVGHVVAVDLSASRLERAARFGADAVVRAGSGDLASELRSLHGEGRRGAVGTDVFIDAAGAPAALDEIVQMGKYRSHVTVVAVYKQPVPMDLSAMLHKEMTLATSLAYPDELGDVVTFLGANAARMQDYISDQFPLADFDAAVARAREADAAKVMIRMD
jgi:threonine dehydrogenase-like Zn-dependent dehydrogenase